MNNTRFATLIHILTLLSKYKGTWLNSDFIAGSIQINPVMVRKELAVLQQEGWVVSKKGKEGGTMLKKSDEEIKLSDIFMLVKNSNVLGKKNVIKDTKCPVGKQINRKLEAIFDEADNIIFQSLEHKTLKSFADNF